MKNNISRNIVEILEKSNEPLTAREIMHKLSVSEEKYKYIASILWSYKIKGIVQECDYKYCSIGNNSVKSWKIIQRKPEQKKEQIINISALQGSDIKKNGITLVIRIDEDGIELISNEKIKVAS